MSKKKKRVNKPKDVLAAESGAITQFMFDVTYPLEGAKFPLEHVLEVYKVWRKKNKMSETVLSVDGFGRLFPHVYPRGPAWWPPLGYTLQCVLDMGLKS